MTSLHRRASEAAVCGFRAHYTTSTVTASSVSCIERIQQRPCLHHWNYPQGGYRRLYISIEPSSRGRLFEIIVRKPRLDTGLLSERRGVLDWFLNSDRYIPAVHMNGVEEVIQCRNLVLMRPIGGAIEGQGHRLGERDGTGSSHGYVQVEVMASSS